MMAMAEAEVEMTTTTTARGKCPPSLALKQLKRLPASHSFNEGAFVRILIGFTETTP